MNRTQNLFSLVSTLGGVRRFSLLKQVHSENVLEHTGMVVIFAYSLATQINAVTTDATRTVDLGLVLSRATVHDFDEFTTGDVVRPTKYHSPALREAFKAVEDEGIQKLAERLSLPRLISHHRHAKHGPEGYLVAFADQMAAAHHVWSEVLLCGNLHMALPARALRDIFTQLWRDVPKEFDLNAYRIIDDHGKNVVRMLEEVAAKSNGLMSLS